MVSGCLSPRSKKLVYLVLAIFPIVALFSDSAHSAKKAIFLTEFVYFRHIQRLCSVGQKLKSVVP